MGLGTVTLGQATVGNFQASVLLGDHLFVALGETDVVSVAVGLRRRGNNPDT